MTIAPTENPNTNLNHPANLNKPGNPPAAPRKTDPIFKAGDGTVFDTSEDLAKYTRTLELKVAAANSPKPFEAASTTETTDLSDASTNINEDLLYTNPKGFVTAVIQSVRGDIQKEKATSEFWNKFYEQNPDLKAASDIVDSVLRARGEEWKKLSVEEGTKALVSEARKRVQNILSSRGIKEEVLSNREANTLSSSGESVKSSPIAQKETTFVEEMQQMRRKK